MSAYRRTTALPPHLADWSLPPSWSWGPEGVFFEQRHYQEIVDALGRSLSLVSVPDATHAAWLECEARHLAHRNHPAIPTTYHYWARYSPEARRGPGYLRRWIAGETVGARLARAGAHDLRSMLRLLRDVGSALAYLHDGGQVHGCVSPEAIWMTPMGRIWMLGWQWAVPLTDVPAGQRPSPGHAAQPAEWKDGWRPSPASDQWQLAALCFTALTCETPPAVNAPPLGLVRPDCPTKLAEVLDQALSERPEDRFPSVSALLRAADRVMGGRSQVTTSGEIWVSGTHDTEEVRLRWATGDDYDVLARIGTGTFGSVWRVRDLSLGREVALKLLHPHVARDARAVARFRREAQLTAQLAHPAIVPIYDFDTRGDVSWYTMELAEGGSVADHVRRSGPRSVAEVAMQTDAVMSALVAAHAIGVIHRDIKPENVLIDRYGRWRVADFGIANIAGEEAAGTSGTPAFGAPEQLLGEAQYPATDCYSLAAVVYFALTGRPPFGEGETKVILARVLAGKVDLSGLEDRIASWLRRALAPEPAQRFADASEMQAEWREAVRGILDRDRSTPWWQRFFSGEHEAAVRS